MPTETDFKQCLRADSNDFGLHAAMRGAGEHRQTPEQLHC